MEESPFPDLDIACGDFLDTLEDRQYCPKCEKSRKFYCYSCFVPVEATVGRIPRVELPLKVDIIKHPQELDGKSTSSHAAVIAPDDVTVYTYPDIPDYQDPSKVVLVFPGGNSLTMEQYAARFSHLTSDGHLEIPTVSDMVTDDKTCCRLEEGVKNLTVCGDRSSLVSPVVGKTKGNGAAPREMEQPAEVPSCEFDTRNCHQGSHYQKTFERVVFIDSTWYQVRRIYMDERIAKLQRIELKSQETKFWRHHQNKPSTYLSTIEAIYYFLREYHDLYESQPYRGQYDNLLFLFVYMYQKIRKKYEGSKILKAYKEKTPGESDSSKKFSQKMSAENFR